MKYDSSYMKVFVAEACNCRPGVPFADGRLPSYTDKLDDAANAVLHAHQMEATDPNFPRYWAVHYKNRHILTVTWEGEAWRRRQLDGTEEWVEYLKTTYKLETVS